MQLLHIINEKRIDFAVLNHNYQRNKFKQINLGIKMKKMLQFEFES